MRLGFSLFFFLFSLAFTFMSFQFEFLTDSGRPDAGFFPIIIGILLIIFSGISCLKDLKHGTKAAEGNVYVREMAWIIGLIAALLLVLKYIGALISMIIFIFAVLFLFNREKMAQNLMLSILVPAIIFLLFDYWLNAGLPKGMLGF